MGGKQALEVLEVVAKIELFEFDIKFGKTSQELTGLRE